MDRVSGVIGRLTGLVSDDKRARPMFTGRDIERWCGTAQASRGRSYYQSGRVIAFGPHPTNEGWYRATVKGSSAYTVDLGFSGEDAMSATCNCPAYSALGRCKHVAAALYLLEASQSNSAVLPVKSTIRERTLAVAALRSNSSSAGSSVVGVASPAKASATRQLASFLAVFERESVKASSESRLRGPEALTSETLLAQFVLQVSATTRPTLSVQVKMGPKRLYVVQKIDEFLSKLDRGGLHAFSSRFTFDPKQHQFRPQDATVIDILRKIHRLEVAYRQPRNPYGSGYYASRTQDRSLFIPAAEWEPLLTALREVNVYLDYGPHSGPLTWGAGPLPLLTHVEKRVDGQFNVRIGGLSQILPIIDYGMALSHSTLYALDLSNLDRLQQLKTLNRNQDEVRLTLSAHEFELFLHRALPGLRQLGTVEMTNRVAEIVVDLPLVARIYLDRNDDKLTARLEFGYGDLTFNPLREERNPQSGLVVRNVEAEQQLIDELEAYQFTRGRGVFELADEEAIYQFLFGALNELEQRVEVYATPQVDPLVRRRHAQPKTSVDLDSGEDWLEVSFEVEELDDEDIQALLRSIIEKRRFHRLRDGSFISLETRAYQDIGKLLGELDASGRDFHGSGLKVAAVRALSLSEQESQASMRWGKSLRRWLENLHHPENLEFPVPESLALVLRDYQRTGFEWMKMLAEYGFGGILADDMGLGKTLQSIAFLVSERERGPFSVPALIVCPASLVYNWQAELEKFAPQLTSAVIAGSREERLAVLEQKDTETDKYDVWITSYPLLRRDVEYYQRSFHAVILDEAQVIKNHATQTAKAVTELVSPRRFALTGTPVENSLEDLWSIFHAVFPGLFQQKKAFSGMNPDQVARRVRPFILRRLKSDVLTELPPKIETVESSELVPEQKRLYMAYLTKLKEETADRLTRDSFQKSRFQILAGLTRLRQLCCHPGLFVENYEGESGKLEQLLELIEECLSADKRLLIFSQFTSMLAIIREAIEARGWSSFYLDGNTPSQERLELCNQFNQGQRPIFLISLKAGGTGLNLTGADTVILYDLWWNPAVEAQAADRAHRIGQQKVVQVIRMITRGTIEEKIYHLQEKKRDLIDRVVTANSEGLEALSEADVRELLNL